MRGAVPRLATLARAPRRTSEAPSEGRVPRRCAPRPCGMFERVPTSARGQRSRLRAGPPGRRVSAAPAASRRFARSRLACPPAVAVWSFPPPARLRIARGPVRPPQGGLPPARRRRALLWCVPGALAQLRSAEAAASAAAGGPPQHPIHRRTSTAHTTRPRHLGRHPRGARRGPSAIPPARRRAAPPPGAPQEHASTGEQTRVGHAGRRAAARVGLQSSRGSMCGAFHDAVRGKGRAKPLRGIVMQVGTFAEL
jgi:hypothetical protein